ncbi:MAG: L-seryl-tRNA(Sec) selenium transferase [Gemmatimonadota bacterium]|nr:L-seryl-tRNA(Sec) selenium transferase [Gemmatimonadota bacterium]
MTTERRSLPSVGVVLERPAMRALIERSPRTLVTDAVRAIIADARADGHGGATLPVDDDGWVREVEQRIAHRIAPSLRATINATGVVLHTNLGRAPLAALALEAIAEVSRGASTLEYDLARGARGSRHVHCAALLTELTGAEDALVVNNCAAALVLALQAFAAGRETLVSRGELVEIGGSFRVPEIMSTSGTTLVEVGTTNRTHVDDYRRALGPRTGAIVKVHRSNFAQEGFVAEASVRDLATVAADAGVPLIHDFGSGLMVDLSPWGLTGEPTARDAAAEGATLVLMSGDKLLGGPQAGIILGRAAAVARLRQHPLARALRVDKLTLAALEATLGLYRDTAIAVQAIPALAMLTATPARVRARADAVVATLARYGQRAHVAASEATVGGGAFPTARLPSWCVVLEGDAVTLEARLRAGAVPVIGRIADGRLLLDLRSVLEAEDATLATLVRAALG